jgi:hypothetical protein
MQTKRQHQPRLNPNKVFQITDLKKVSLQNLSSYQITQHLLSGAVRTWRLALLRCAVSEAVPVQNQAAAQKLLQKMAQVVPEERHGRGQRFKGKGRHEDIHVSSTPCHSMLLPDSTILVLKC